MTTLETIGVAGFGLTIAVNAVVGGITYGALRAEVKDLRDAVRADGKNGFVRGAEVDLLVKQAESEHRVMNSEITTLRERVHGHERLIGEHEARISILEEAGS